MTSFHSVFSLKCCTTAISSGERMEVVAFLGTCSTSRSDELAKVRNNS